MSETAQTSRADRFQSLLNSETEPERFVRQSLQYLEDEFRTMSLLALADWHRLEIVQPEMFHAVAALQRPSWGMWNGLLTALKNARKEVLRGADDELRQKVEGAQLLDTILKQLNLRLDADIRDSLKPLSGLCNSPVPNKLRLGAILTLPISLRNRIAHDAPSDANWWRDTADAIRPLVDFHTHLSPLALLLSEEYEYPSPWFLVGDDGSVRAFNGLERDQAVNYAGIDGSPVSVPERVQDTLLAFQSLLGKSNTRETDFRKLLSKLAPDEIKGVMLGGLLVGKPVGAGGFATVHLGRQLATGRRIAVKILHDGQGERNRERFQQEARFLSRMDHPHVVHVYGYGEDTWSAPRSISLSDEKWFQEFSKSAPVRSYIALEWVDGRTLDDVFRDPDGALDQPQTPTGSSSFTQNDAATDKQNITSVPENSQPGPQVVDHRLRKSERYRILARWFSESASALSAVHNSGLVHRDIKPSNLMVNSEGSIHLMDFGIARTQDRERTLKTTTGSALGTPAYMAPEQLRASSQDEVGPAADVYSLSATFYELFTGKRLFDHDTSTLEVVATKKLQGDRPRRPRRFARGLPWELEAILLGGLEPNVRDRYSSMEALRLDIENFLVDQPITYRRPGLLRRMWLGYRRNRTLTNVVMCFLFLAAFGLFQFVHNVINSEQREHDLRVQREEQLRIATSTGLAATALASRDEDPILGVLLARESVKALVVDEENETTPDPSSESQSVWETVRSLFRDEEDRPKAAKPVSRESILPAAYQSLLESVANAGGQPLPGHETHLNDVKLSADNRWLASCASDGTFRVTDLFAVFDVPDELPDQFAPQPPPSGAPSVNPQSAQDPPPGFSPLPAQPESVEVPQDAPVPEVPNGAQSPPGINGQAGTVDLNRLPYHSPTFDSVLMNEHKQESLCIAFDPSRRWMATGGNDGSIILWEHGDADGNGKVRLLHRFSAGEAAVTQLAFGPFHNQPKLVSGSADGSVRVWNPDKPDEKPHLLTPIEGVASEPVTSLVVTENIILSINATYGCQCWFELNQPAQSFSLVTSTGAIDRYRTTPGRTTAAVSPDFRWLLVGSGYFDAAGEEPNEPNSADGKSAEDESGKQIPKPKAHRFGSDDPAYCGAFSADSQFLATARGDGSVLVEPLGDRHGSWVKPRTLTGHDGLVQAITFGPQSRYVVTASEDRSIRIWDNWRPTGEALVLRGHAAAVRFLSFSCVARTLHYWDTHSGTSVWPGPAVVISGCDDGTLRAWDVSDIVKRSEQLTGLSVSPSPKVFANRNILATSFCQDHTRVALGLWSQSSRVLTLTKDGMPSQSVGYGWHDASPVRLLAISPNGNWLLLNGNSLYDATIKTSHLNGQGSCATYQHPNYQTPEAFCWSPDSQAVFTALNGRIRRWRLPPIDENRDERFQLTRYAYTEFDSPEHEFAAPTGKVTSMSRPVDTELLYCGFQSGSIAIIDLRNSETQATDSAAHQLAVTSIVFDSKNRRMVTSGEDSHANIWDVSEAISPKKIQTLRGHSGPIRSTAFSADGRYVVTGSADTTIRIWDLQATDPARKCTVVRGHDRAVTGVTFSRDGNRLISTSEDGTVRIWELRVDRLLEFCDEIAGRDLTPDEKRLYLGTATDESSGPSSED